MKKISLSVFSFLALCILLCTACSDDAQYKADLSQIQRTIDIARDSLSNELWLEVEKNEVIKLCLDSKVRTWETKLHSKTFNDSCLAFQVPTLIGVDTIKVYFPDSDSLYNINLAVGMKYLNFKNEEVLLGSNLLDKYPFLKNFTFTTKQGSYHLHEEDPERLASVTGTYLIDKYPVTNCEITQLLWDTISIKNKQNNSSSRVDKFVETWISRKKASIHNEDCAAKDTATDRTFLYTAMQYANARSRRDGLKPYYVFTSTNEVEPKILSKNLYIIGYYGFAPDEGKETIQVSIDKSSDGYRLPYYDEWMTFARGGDKKNKAPWSNSSENYEEFSKYAKFNPNKGLYESEPVGQLLPNGYGLYDMLGLVWEHVLFEEKNPFREQGENPSCFKGGELESDWRIVDYGYSRGNYYSNILGGFRLIRNIGNNAKWSNDKVQKRKQK